MKSSLLGWSMVLVATALVACGDDSETTGAGGAGGDSTASTGTSAAGNPTVSSSGTPTSVSSGNSPTSTSTGSPDGGSGPGGGGQGGSGNCTALTIDDIENQSQQGVGFLIGTPNPALGGDAEDRGQVEIYDDGGETFDGAVPGEFDLSQGAEANYASCSRCVRALEDIDEEGAIAKQYFQESGTWNLAEEGNAITIGLGTLTLTDVVLVEVTVDPETFESTPVAGGDCYYIESLVYDNPSVPESGDECSDFADSDGDSLIDCDDDSDCQGSAACEPGATLTGAACDANTDCAATGDDPLCISEELFGVHDGACSEWCDLEDDDCPAGSVCLDIGAPHGVCLPECETSDDCRDADGVCTEGTCLPGPAACFDAHDPLVLTDDGDTTDGTAFGTACSEGPSVLYNFTTTVAGDYTFTLESDTDQGIAVRTSCVDASEDSETCTDGEVGGTDEVLTVTLEAATTVTVIVSAFGAGEEGPYTVSVALD